MKTDQELLDELAAECPSIPIYSGARHVEELKEYLRKKQESELALQGEAIRRVDMAMAAVLEREAVIAKLEGILKSVGDCLENPMTSDFGRATTKVSLPRRVTDLIKNLNLRISAAETERALKEGESYVPLVDYYRRPLERNAESVAGTLPLQQIGQMVDKGMVSKSWVLERAGLPSRAPQFQVAPLPEGELDPESSMGKFLKYFKGGK